MSRSSSVTSWLRVPASSLPLVLLYVAQPALGWAALLCIGAYLIVRRLRTAAERGTEAGQPATARLAGV